MNIIGICSRLYPDVAIFTFEIMSNHFHFVLCEDIVRVDAFSQSVRFYLSRYLKSEGASGDLSNLEFKHRLLTSLDDVRNVIAYDNRNGFLVSRDMTPFTYPWGAHKYFFATDAVNRYSESSCKMHVSEIREVIHSHNADKVVALRKLDGYVCPLCFCEIELAQSFFRDASHYFYLVSRLTESYVSIAKELGDKEFYTDDELFAVMFTKFCKPNDVKKSSLLPVDVKLEAAKVLHFDYFASRGKIMRFLKLSEAQLNDIVPPPL